MRAASGAVAAAMGKVRALRARVHPAAVRPEGGEAGAARTFPGGLPARHLAGPAGEAPGPSVEPASLEQRLRPDTGAAGTDAHPQAARSKREKRRQRRERWLQKIEAVRAAERERRAEQKRRAAPVVGDLQPLRDALPLLLPEPEPDARGPRRRSSKPRPTELSRMSGSQRLQLLEEERARFWALLASPGYRASPLLTIGHQLAQRLRLEGGPP